MMRNLGIKMEVECPKGDVLRALYLNRANHADLVKDARAGYADKALAAMNKRLGELREGKLVSVRFNLEMPTDYTEVYDTAIHMLELHTGETVTLSPDEFRHLIDDKWEWLEHFVAVNSAYSTGTRAYGSSKGIDG